MQKKILIVEDDPGIGQLYQDLLRSEGYKTNLVLSGKEAIHFIENNPQPCLVLTDLAMADMVASDFVGILRQQDMLITIPVMIATHKDPTHSKQQKDLIKLRKPLEVKMILEQVKKFCGTPFTECQRD